MAAARRPSTARAFARYAILSLLPVLGLGAVLVRGAQADAHRRGLSEAGAQAALVAHAAVEPLLQGHPLSDGLTPAENEGLERLARRSIGGDLLRLRLRSLDGKVVYSDDGSGFDGPADDEALEAGEGEKITLITHLNADANDHGPAGASAVEAYRPLYAGGSLQPVGVLEVYLPYAPIADDLAAGLHQLYRNLAIGLLVLYFVGFALSVTLSRGLRHQLKVNAFLAEHDSLTQLPNRTRFRRLAADAVRAARSNGRPVAIAIVDLDRFKEINDTLGHHTGDEMLTELARRLAQHTGAEDCVARLGGDEFGVIITDFEDGETALRRLRGLIDHEIELHGLPLSVEASIGFVVAPDDGDDVDELLQRADVAMYVAKARHSGVARYRAEDDQYDARNLELIADFRRALHFDDLVLHYQPKLRIEDGRVDVVEALVRWQHPAHGLLYPDSFIPLIEPTDLVEPLTDWVLERAIADIRALDDESIAVAVNVSARNLSDNDFARRVLELLDRLHTPADRLIIEITETALLVDPDRAASMLSELHAAGVRVSLDDFGQGQTSLGYLSALQLDELKIDKAFVLDMLDNPAHAAIVRSIVDLGHNLGLEVVSEGVETDDVLAAVTATGCDVAQGYLFARPMPVDALADWLTERRVSIIPT